MKLENNELKRVSIKNRMCYYFDDIIKFEDFDFDIILLAKKSYENICTFRTTLWLIQNLCILCSIKKMGLLEFIMELGI